MRTHTQLKIFFAAVLIALATLTIVTAPARASSAERIAGSRLQTMRHDARVITLGRTRGIRDSTISCNSVSAEHVERLE